LEFFIFYGRPFYIHFSLLEFALVKRVFTPRQYSAALGWGTHGNTVCPKGKGNGNVSAV